MDKVGIVDLDSGNVTVRDLSKDERYFIGGKGLGFRVIWEEMREDLIVFSAGPLTGLRMART